jgi:dipeptidyl aminopeptidase/acylaminoacyl peptidase
MVAMTREAPFGSWASPLTAAAIVEASVGLGGPAFAGGDLWWSELRPQEAGRVQLVRAGPDGPFDVLPEGFSARTRVHEYGGGAWWLHGADDEPGSDVTAFFVNWSDQRLYRLEVSATGAVGEPVAITPEPDEPAGLRYADGIVSADGEIVICVREWHGAPGATEARNEIVALPADGSAEPTILVGGFRGPDFVSNPRLSPDESSLAWLQWGHPDMPWDAAELWVGAFDPGSVVATPTIEGAEHLAGGPDESVAQPRWDHDGRLWFVSDRNGWWDLYAFAAPGRPVAGGLVDSRLRVDDGDWAQPQWVFGQSWYDFLPGNRGLVACRRKDGTDQLAWRAGPERASADEDGPPPWGEPVWLDLDISAVDGVVAGPDATVAMIASSLRSEARVVTIDTSSARPDHFDLRVVRPARDLGFDDARISVPEHLEFPTPPSDDGRPAVAHVLFYPPLNPDFVGPPGELPPLLVMIHGGPTSAARPQLNPSIQFWTSRGFAVADVNYRGSSGYGREFRLALNGAWGIADVDDCIAAARSLAGHDRVDGRRLAIRGGSAGGYTTLCALTFHDEFSAGCSLYGVADLEALALDTHKFESRYLDRLVGPYPEERERYVERSPIHHVDRLATPLLILQGLEDEIVPPAQAEMMADALRRKGVPFAYLPFEGEQHGFRQAPNIRRALEAELYFYSRVFGFDLSEPVEPVEIEHLA